MSVVSGAVLLVITWALAAGLDDRPMLLPAGAAAPYPVPQADRRAPLATERVLLEEPLIDDAAALESYRENCARLLVITDQRTQLLESLLTLAGSEHAPGPTELVDLCELIDQALRERATGIGRRELQVRCDLLPVRISGDRLLLARLLANLVVHAIHYNPDGGTVGIGVRREVGRIVLCVAGTGQAVPPDQVDRLFEPFQRLRRIADDGHHGLGLSIVRASASLHKAEITAGARPDGGLRVEVASPVVG